MCVGESSEQNPSTGAPQGPAVSAGKSGIALGFLE